MPEITVSSRFQEAPKGNFIDKLKSLWEAFQSRNTFTKASLIVMAIIIFATPAIIAQQTNLFSKASTSLYNNCTPIPKGLTQDQIQQLSQSGKVMWCNGPTQNLHTTVFVGPEEYVTGPVDYIDSAVYTIPYAGGIRGFVANSYTYEFTGPTLQTLNWQIPHPTSDHTALGAGPTGNFDDCGSWLLSAYKLTDTHWIGWYHAEHHCTNPSFGPYWSVGFAESFDAGRTWQKTGYPNNEVLTGDSIYTGNPTFDKFSGLQVASDGTYFYIESEEAAPVALARSKVSDMGKPGTWYKWYCDSSHSCGFSQPGLGGHSTQIRNIGQSVIYNTYLGEYVSIINSAGHGDIFGKYGFSLSMAPQNDISSWEAFNNKLTIYPPVSFPGDPRVDHWSSNQTGLLSTYGYISLIDSSGNSSQIGQSFYLYYMKVFENDLFSQRYLMRRLITLGKSNDLFVSKVALVRYQKSNPQKILVSTEIARPSEGYTQSQIIGSILTYPSSGFKPLYLCYIPTYQEYMPTDVDPSKYNWQHCENPNGDNFVRTLGYISTTQTPETPIAIYRCFDSRNLNHFISTDPSCEGKQVNWKLGYIFRDGTPQITPPQGGGDINITLTPAQSTPGQTSIVPIKGGIPTGSLSVTPVHRLNPGGKP